MKILRQKSQTPRAVFRDREPSARLRWVAGALALPLAALAAEVTESPGQFSNLRPPRPEIPPGFWEQNGYWVIIAAVLALAMCGVAVWVLTRPRPAAVVPPEVKARKALDQLRQRPEDGGLLIQVSRILRHYIAAAFSLPRDEMTTAEFCEAIGHREEIGGELSEAVGRFLRQCDREKFAPPPKGPPMNAAAQALALVELGQGRLASLRQSAASESPKEER